MTRQIGGVCIDSIPVDPSAVPITTSSSYPSRHIQTNTKMEEEGKYRSHSYKDDMGTTWKMERSHNTMTHRPMTDSTTKRTPTDSPTQYTTYQHIHTNNMHHSYVPHQHDTYDRASSSSPCDAVEESFLSSTPTPRAINENAVNQGLATTTLRRSGTGGFYEFDMTDSNLSLVDMLHESSEPRVSTSSAIRPSSSIESLTQHSRFSVTESSTIENESQISMSPNASSSEPPLVPSSVTSTAPKVTTMVQQEDFDRTNLLGTLACSLEQICPLTDVLPSDPHHLSLFHTSALPSISIRDYLIRLAGYTGVSSECLIQSCIHIHRLARSGRAEVQSRMNPSISAPVGYHPRINSFSQQPFLVSAYNIHRLLLTAMLTSAKFSDDAFYNNKIYSTLGGISLKELNRLECEFLSLVDYRMYISAADFIAEYDRLNAACNHGSWCLKRGHSSGPTMRVHLEDPNLYDTEDDSDDSSAGSSIAELDVAAFQISPATLTTTETERATIHSFASQPTSLCHSRTASDDRMNVSSTATTPVYSHHIPSSSPTSDGYVSEGVHMPMDDHSQHTTIDHHRAHTYGTWYTHDTQETKQYNFNHPTFHHRPHSMIPMHHTNTHQSSNPPFLHATLHAAIHEYRETHETTTNKDQLQSNHHQHHDHASAPSFAFDGCTMSE